MTTRGLFWGILLITLGVVFLGQNYGWFDLDWSAFSRFWPLLIILAGLNLIFARRNNTAAVITTVLLAIAGPLAIVSAFRSSDRYDRYENRFRDDDDDDSEGSVEGDADDNDNDDEKDNDGDLSETKVRSNHIAEPMDSGVQEARLTFESGAGRFFITSTADSLIEADTRMTVSNYSMSVNRDDQTRLTDIELKLDDDEINLKSGELVNRVDLRLNPAPIWSFEFAIGAGLAEFDLSPYQVKSLKLGAGAADIDLKMGDRAPLADVRIESGVASVTLEIPRTVGCQIEFEGALNVKKLDGFTEIGGGIHQTAGYEGAAKKIKVKFEGGMSRFRVDRY